MSTFLTDQEVAALTGRKMRSRQIEALKQMGIAFFVNALGHPIVSRSLIDGKAPEKAEKSPTRWQSNAMQRAA